MSGTPDDPDFHPENHPGFLPWLLRFAWNYVTWWKVALMAVTYNVLKIWFAQANVIAFWIIPAVLATLFGLATSLGFGAEQASAGLNFLFGTSEGAGMKIMLILGITAVATMSVVAGLDSGVKRVSELNMVLAFLLLVLAVGMDARGRYRRHI